jgi:hypothetical protein
MVEAKPGLPVSLYPTPSCKKQVQNHDQQDQAQSTPAVVTDTRSHVVAAAANQQKEDYQEDYEHRGISFDGSGRDHRGTAVAAHLEAD